MKIRFFLDDKQAERTSVVLTLREGAADHGRKSLRIGTGIIVNTKSWDFDGDRIKKNHSGFANVNRKLSEIEAKARDLYEYAKRTLKVEPFPFIKETIRKDGVLERPIDDVRDGQLMRLLDCFAEYIALHKTGDTKKGIPKHATNSIKNYNTVYKHLGEFLGRKGRTCTFDHVDDVFFRNYTEYLLTKARLSNTTVNKNLRIVKTFLFWAQKAGYNSSIAFEKAKVGFKESNSTLIALSDTQLSAIESVDLSDAPRLSRVRDLFLIGCYTGMRFSDIVELQPHHIQEDFIRFVVTKTKQTIAIPISPRLHRILKQYPECKFPKISNQRANDFLKEVAERAGLCELIETKRMTGGAATNELVELVPLYSVVTTHTARRTFITLSLNKGVQPHIVMNVSGHKDHKSFQKYVKHNDDHTREQITKAWG